MENLLENLLLTVMLSEVIVILIISHISESATAVASIIELLYRFILVEAVLLLILDFKDAIIEGLRWIISVRHFSVQILVGIIITVSVYGLLTIRTIAMEVEEDNLTGYVLVLARKFQFFLIGTLLLLSLLLHTVHRVATQLSALKQLGG